MNVLTEKWGSRLGISLGEWFSYEDDLCQWSCGTENICINDYCVSSLQAIWYCMFCNWLVLTVRTCSFSSWTLFTGSTAVCVYSSCKLTNSLWTDSTLSKAALEKAAHRMSMRVCNPRPKPPLLPMKPGSGLPFNCFVMLSTLHRLSEIYVVTPCSFILLFMSMLWRHWNGTKITSLLFQASMETHVW